MSSDLEDSLSLSDSGDDKDYRPGEYIMKKRRREGISSDEEGQYRDVLGKTKARQPVPAVTGSFKESEDPKSLKTLMRMRWRSLVKRRTQATI